MKVKVQTLDGKAGADIDLNDDVFGVDARADILHRVVAWQLEKRRGPARAAAGSTAASRSAPLIFSARTTGRASSGGASSRCSCRRSRSLGSQGNQTAR